MDPKQSPSPRHVERGQQLRGGGARCDQGESGAVPGQKHSLVGASQPNVRFVVGPEIGFAPLGLPFQG